MADTLIKSRCVISIGDYEPIDIAQQFANFQRNLQRFGQTWNVTTKISPIKIEADGAVAIWHTEAKSSNWKTKTEFRILNWSDIVKRDFRRWNLTRLWRVAKALPDFVISGTCWRYFRANRKFALLFFYPIIVAAICAVIGYWVGTLWSNFDVPLAPFFGIAVGAALYFSFIKWIDPVVLPRVVDMWIFLYELVHLERNHLAERLGVFIQDVVTQLESHNFDEILIVGHGIGAVLQPIIVDRAFWALPEFGKDGRSVSLLSLGSLLLAVGFHPEGGWVVGPMSRLARDGWVYWVEYQAEEDILSFPGHNPVTELISDHGKPKLQKVQISDMVEVGPKKRFPETTYLNHRQFVRANSKRYFYDYFMICCGPFALPARVKYRDHMVTAFGGDGHLVADE